MQVPREMTRADMDRVRDDFVRATQMAIDAGFDMVELHCAHGYLLSGFITPLSQPADRRIRRIARKPPALPAGGLPRHARGLAARTGRCPCASRPPTGSRAASTADDAVEVAQAFHAAGADIIHVSAGQTSPDAKPVYGRMFQTPFSDRIRNETASRRSPSATSPIPIR